MKRKRIVTIGGGTGSFTLLSGLKKYPVDISAIVSMADDGGSTGVLRDELGVLPPGDVRQCLVALSESSDMLRELLNYRFDKGSLKGHNFGNLLLSALEKIKGNFNDGVEEASKILNVKGEVIPVTNDHANLFLKLKNGKILEGEDEINHNFSIQQSGIEKMYFSPKVKANPKALKRIAEAEMIIIGPGNHYCSIMPNFLVKGIADAIKKSKAPIVYNCNLVNKPGHTELFSLDDYVDSINSFIGKERIDFVTFNVKKPGKSLIERYESKKELMIEFDPQARQKRTYRVIRGDILSNKRPTFSISDALTDKRAFIRHDSHKLAEMVMMLLEIGKYESIIKEIL
jgi:uncharacterized cofD-like protein